MKDLAERKYAHAKHKNYIPPSLALDTVSQASNDYKKVKPQGKREHKETNAEENKNKNKKRLREV